MQIVDLTRPLSEETTVLPGDPPVTLALARSHKVDGYQVTHVCMGSHSGTHLDAPRHFFPDGATLDRYPMERFVQPGVILDVRPPATRGTSTDEREAGTDGAGMIETAHLGEQLGRFPVPAGGFALLWTAGAHISVDGARLLLKSGATLVGTDAPSLDADPYPAHRLLLGHDILIAEELYGLERLGPGPVFCAFLPLAVVGADGAPVRAIAWR